MGVSGLNPLRQSKGILFLALLTLNCNGSSRLSGLFQASNSPSSSSASSSFIPSSQFNLQLLAVDPALQLSLGSYSSQPLSNLLHVQWNFSSANKVQIIIDNSAGMNQPMINQIISTSNPISLADFNLTDSGITPGGMYYIRVIPDGNTTRAVSAQFRYFPTPTVVGDLNYNYLKNSWAGMRPGVLLYYSGVHWNSSSMKWDSLVSWEDTVSNVPGLWANAGAKGYFIQEHAYGAAHMADTCHDLHLLSELSDFYNQYFGRFMTVTELRQRAATYNPPLDTTFFDRILYGPNSGNVKVLPVNLNLSCSRDTTSCDAQGICSCVCASYTHYNSAISSCNDQSGKPTGTYCRYNSNTNTCAPPKCQFNSGTNTCNFSALEEYTLDTGQTFYPVTKLIRSISALPLSDRSPSMLSFVSTYASTVIKDNVLRYFYIEPNVGGSNRVVTLQTLILALQGGAKPHYPTPGVVMDNDLWWAIHAAELLGANANDPTLVPIAAADKTNLVNALNVIFQALQYERTIYNGTINFQGQPVTSISYFNGDFWDYVDNQYAGYAGELYPTSANAKTVPTISWDISHFTRFPIFLRSMYDNKKVTGSTYPSPSELSGVVNQFSYRVFQGSFSSPLFNTFFDGTNGWYRVGYDGPNTAMPPAEYCSYGTTLYPGQTRYCQTPPALMGWGLLGEFQPDFLKIEDALIAISGAIDPGTTNFRTHYYGNFSFQFRDSNNNLNYPTTNWAFSTYSAISERLQGCSAQ